MSATDVIKGSVYNMLAGGTELSTMTVLFRLCLAGIIGIYVFFLYKHESKAAFYSKDLNITISGLPIVIAALMIAMQSNLIVSLGMVGALSIVRFRTAIKNPLDLLYLFWSISAGILCGVGLIVLALLASTVITALIIILQIIPLGKTSSIVVLRTSKDDVDWESVGNSLKKHAKNVKEKSRSLQSGQTEVIYELVSGDEEALMKELNNFEQIDDINFLSHDGEFHI